MTTLSGVYRTIWRRIGQLLDSAVICQHPASSGFDPDNPGTSTAILDRQVPDNQLDLVMSRPRQRKGWCQACPDLQISKTAASSVRAIVHRIRSRRIYSGLFMETERTRSRRAGCQLALRCHCAVALRHRATGVTRRSLWSLGDPHTDEGLSSGAGLLTNGQVRIRRRPRRGARRTLLP